MDGSRGIVGILVTESCSEGASITTALSDGWSHGPVLCLSALDFHSGSLPAVQSVHCPLVSDLVPSCLPRSGSLAEWDKGGLAVLGTAR